VVAGAQLQCVRGAAVIGREGDLRPVGETFLEQELDDLGHRVDAQLDEEAAHQFVPSLFRRLHLVIRGEARRREGVDRGQVPQARGMPLDDAARREGRLDHAPQAPIGGVLRVPHGRPVHDLVETRDHQAMGHELFLLRVTEIAAAPFISGRRHGRARQREYLEGRAAFPCLEPELEIVWAIHIRELVTRFAGPGVAAGQHERRLPFGRQMRALDMLVDLAEARHGGKLGFVDTLLDLALIMARGPDEGDPSRLDDDLPILLPGARMDVQKAPDAERCVGWALAKRRQHEILADADLICGIDQRVLMGEVDVLSACISKVDVVHETAGLRSIDLDGQVQNRPPPRDPAKPNLARRGEQRRRGADTRHVPQRPTANAVGKGRTAISKVWPEPSPFAP
jgi:hypothetical protein